MIISHSSYNRELLKWQCGWRVWQDDCWPIDILDECPANLTPTNFNIICAIYGNLVWLYFNEDKLPKMIGNSDWYIRIYPPDICPPRNLVDDHGCLPHWSPHSRRFSFNLHSVGAWWRPRWLNGSCFFDRLQQSPLKKTVRYCRSSIRKATWRLKARHPNPKYTPENLHGAWRSPLWKTKIVFFLLSFEAGVAPALARQFLLRGKMWQS